MTLIDYMYQEKKEEEDLPTLKTVFTHKYNDLKTTEKSAKEDRSQPPEIILTKNRTNRTTITRNQ